MTRTIDDREQWFLDRVGKVIFRNETSCKCLVCAKVYENGLYLTDENHATYTYDFELVYNTEVLPLKYFDTKQEAIDYEKTLNNERK